MSIFSARKRLIILEKTPSVAMVQTNRVIRCCTELGADNPIISIHDQGAGGNCNVLKEIVESKDGST
eukprot:SAG31_NODE_597_length_13674_cov_3.402947_1_plen_66_part_10